jgi:hypothetical protein
MLRESRRQRSRQDQNEHQQSASKLRRSRVPHWYAFPSEYRFQSHE